MYPALSRVVCVCVHVRACAKLLQSSPTLCDPMDKQPARLPCSWNSPGKDTGMGSHALLQGIFPTQGLNPHLLCLLHLVPPGVSNHSLTLLYIWATHYGVSQVALVVVNPPVNTGDVRNTCLAPGLGRSPGVGNGNHCSILSREIPWTEESGGL